MWAKHGRNDCGETDDKEREAWSGGPGWNKEESLDSGHVPGRD